MVVSYCARSPNPGPLYKQQVPLTPELSLSPVLLVFRCRERDPEHCVCEAVILRVSRTLSPKSINVIVNYIYNSLPDLLVEWISRASIMW